MITRDLFAVRPGKLVESDLVYGDTSLRNKHVPTEPTNHNL